MEKINYLGVKNCLVYTYPLFYTVIPLYYKFCSATALVIFLVVFIPLPFYIVQLLTIKEAQKKQTEKGEKPFFDWTSFTILCGICLYLLGYFLIGLAIYKYFFNIENIIIYKQLFLSSTYIISLILVLITVKYFIKKIPNLPESFRLLIIKKVSLEDHLDNLLNVNIIKFRFIVSITVLFTFNWLKYFLTFSWENMLLISCVLTPVIFMIIKSIFFKQKFFTKLNFYVIIYYIFILVLSKFVNLCFIYYISSIFYIFFITPVCINYPANVNNDIPKIKPITEKKEVLIETLDVYLSNNFDKNTSFIYTIKHNIYNFMGGQINSFWKLFDKETNFDYIPKWAWYTASAVKIINIEPVESFKPTEFFKLTEFFKPTEFSKLEQIYLDNSSTDVKYTEIRAKCWALLARYRFELCKDNKVTVTNIEPKNELGLFWKIMLGVQETSHDLYDDTKYIISHCGYSNVLNAKLTSLINYVSNNYKYSPLNNQDLSHIKLLDTEFCELSSYKKAVENIKTMHPYFYYKYLENFEIKPLNISMNTYKRLSDVCVQAKIQNSLITYLAEKSLISNLDKNPLISYLAKNCVVWDDPNFITENTRLFYLNSGTHSSLCSRSIWLSRDYPWIKPVWTAHKAPVLDIIGLHVYDYVDIAAKLGINFDQALWEEKMIRDRVTDIDFFETRFGLDNNRFYNFFKQVKMLNNMYERAVIWYNSLEEGSFIHTCNKDCDASNCLSKNRVLGDTNILEATVGRNDPTVWNYTEEVHTEQQEEPGLLEDLNLTSEELAAIAFGP